MGLRSLLCRSFFSEENQKELNFFSKVIRCLEFASLSLPSSLSIYLPTVRTYLGSPMPCSESPQFPSSIPFEYLPQLLVRIKIAYRRNKISFLIPSVLFFLFCTLYSTTQQLCVQYGEIDGACAKSVFFFSLSGFNLRQKKNQQLLKCCKRFFEGIQISS